MDEPICPVVLCSVEEVKADPTQTWLALFAANTQLFMPRSITKDLHLQLYSRLTGGSQVCGHITKSQPILMQNRMASRGIPPNLERRQRGATLDEDDIK